MIRQDILDNDKRAYQFLRKEAVQLAHKKKKELVTSKLKQGSSKSLFAVMNELVDSKRETVLPVSESGQLLANQSQLQRFVPLLSLSVCSK